MPSPTRASPSCTSTSPAPAASRSASTGPEFILQFEPREIDRLAARFGDSDDAAAEAAGAAARERGHYTAGELALVYAWKSPRSRPLVASNAPVDIEAATRRALASDTSEAGRIDALTGLRGVGLPSASVLLYFAFPDDYPILDVRALESLGVRARSSYTTADVKLGRLAVAMR
jgi:hypothetical protein